MGTRIKHAPVQNGIKNKFFCPKNILRKTKYMQKSIIPAEDKYIGEKLFYYLKESRHIKRLFLLSENTKDRNRFYRALVFN